MTLLEAIVLGIVQGLSEFLPVSSSGHLLVVRHLFGITGDDSLTFIIVLNMGSLMPLLWVFRRDVWALIRNPFQKMTALLIIATLPIITVTILFPDFIETMYNLIYFLPIGFVITGVILLLSDKIKNNTKDIGKLRIIDGVLIGLAQAMAIFPGLTRSGSTLTASLARGLDRENAAKFSFMMSIPTAFGAIAFNIWRIASGRVPFEDLNFVNLGAGFAAAAVVGYFAINFMLNLVKKAKLKYFTLYYIVALVVFIVVFLM